MAAWPLSLRWEVADVMEWLGQLYARAGETTGEGWARAANEGWSIAIVKIRGNVH